MKRLKHKLKLMWLKRKWVIQSVYNTEEFRDAKDFLELERDLTKLYHRAKREGEPKEIARAEGRLEVVKWLKEAE